MELDFHSFIDG
jgi:hypothetical protein